MIGNNIKSSKTIQVFNFFINTRNPLNMKVFYLLLCLMLGSALQSTAQVSSTYRIRVASLQDPFDRATAFEELRDYGALIFEPADNGFTRIYLGQYLGRATAKLVLKKVQNKGYKNAYLVKDTYIFQTDMGKYLTHTLQFVASKKLNATEFLSRMPKTMREELYISYRNGFYRYSFGLFDASIQGMTEEYRQTAEKMGYQESFARQFRDAPPKEISTEVIEP